MATSPRQAEFMRTKGYVTPKEAADLCRTAPGVIYRMLDEGKLHGVRAGRARYVAYSSLREAFPEVAGLLGLAKPAGPPKDG